MNQMKAAQYSAQNRLPGVKTLMPTHKQTHTQNRKLPHALKLNYNPQEQAADGRAQRRRQGQRWRVSGLNYRKSAQGTGKIPTSQFEMLKI